MGAGVTLKTSFLDLVHPSFFTKEQNGKCNPAPMLIINQKKLPSISQTALQFRG